VPIFKYDADVKKKIVEAARGARENSRGWDECLMLAKTEGYRGGLPGLKRIMREADLNGNGASAPIKKRGPGRPRKVAISTSTTPTPVDGLEGIQAAINGLVKNRVACVIAKIRAILDEAEKELG